MTFHATTHALYNGENPTDFATRTTGEHAGPAMPTPELKVRDAAEISPPRYLYGRYRGLPHGGFGLNHTLQMMSSLLACATWLGRIAVLAPLPLSLIHNKYRPVDCDPRLYFDLDGAAIFDKKTAARTPMRHIMASEFDIQQFPEDEILKLQRLRLPGTVHPRYAMDQAHDDKALILFDADCMHSLTLPNGYTYGLTSKRADPDKRIEIPPGKTVRSLAEPIIAALKDEGARAGGPGDYCCVKVRRGDFLHWSTRGHGFAARSRTVYSATNLRLNLVKRGGLDKNTVIYLMSNERDDNYFDRLYADFPRFHTYKDFPEFRRLHPNHGETPNNYLLFAAERLIFQNAALRFVGSSDARQIGFPYPGHLQSRREFRKPWRRALVAGPGESKKRFVIIRHARSWPLLFAYLQVTAERAQDVLRRLRRKILPPKRDI